MPIANNATTVAPLMERLMAGWQGLPIELRVGEAKYVLGRGQPCTTLLLRDHRLLRQILRSPSMAFGEAYVRGDATILEGRLSDVLSGFHRSSAPPSSWRQLLAWLRAFVPDSVARATANARCHYDVGNHFYRLWLDTTRTYSCAYYTSSVESLDQAQRNKLDLICRKLRLERGNRMLDIGCGWGSLAFHAVEHYGAHATCVTPSCEQARYVRNESRRRGIDKQVDVMEMDWRAIRGRFDRIASVGMFEHVGRRQYARFLRKWRQLLATGGFSVLHTISHRLPEPPDPWIKRHIFPGADLPTLEQVIRPAMAAGLRLFRCENLRPHYARTLAAWAENFQRVRHLVVAQFGEAFARKWWLYLQASEAAFRWGDLDLLQIELCGRDDALPCSRDLPPVKCDGAKSSAARLATRVANHCTS